MRRPHTTADWILVGATAAVLAVIVGAIGLILGAALLQAAIVLIVS